MSPSYLIPFLWLLKLGGLFNGVLVVATAQLFASHSADASIILPALILLSVSAYRCLLPVRYEGNVVFHDSPLSSIFLTRLLATSSEVAYIVLFAQVLWRLNADGPAWIDALGWLMAGQVVLSQGFVWAAVLTGQRLHYFYEEAGWLLIFSANTIASAYLYLVATISPNLVVLLELSLAFGALYLPWQIFHLRSLWRAAQQMAAEPVMSVGPGLRRALFERHRRDDAEAWGGWIGLSWMLGYWATLIPAWVYAVAVIVTKHS